MITAQADGTTIQCDLLQALIQLKLSPHLLHWDHRRAIAALRQSALDLRALPRRTAGLGRTVLLGDLLGGNSDRLHAMRGRGNGASLPQDATQRLTASWLINRPAATSASARSSAAASAAGSTDSNRVGFGSMLASISPFAHHENRSGGPSPPADHSFTSPAKAGAQ